MQGDILCCHCTLGEQGYTAINYANAMKEPYTTILAIAGSDPSAGAGLQGDIKTAMVMGVYALTAVTAVTVQNSQNADAIVPVSADLLEQQIDALASDLTIDAVKIGMLPTAESIEAARHCIDRHKLRNIVVDPIASPTLASARCGSSSAFDTLKKCLLPIADIITPNVHEAEMLLGATAGSRSATELAVLLCNEFGSRSALVKGGDCAGDSITDALYEARSGCQMLFFSHSIVSANTHGTGCALSTAIACGLARRRSLHQAAADAERTVHDLIRAGANFAFGKGGYGPLGTLSNLTSNKTNNCIP